MSLTFSNKELNSKHIFREKQPNTILNWQYSFV